MRLATLLQRSVTLAESEIGGAGVKAGRAAGRVQSEIGGVGVKAGRATGRVQGEIA